MEKSTIAFECNMEYERRRVLEMNGNERMPFFWITLSGEYFKGCKEVTFISPLIFWKKNNFKIEYFNYKIFAVDMNLKKILKGWKF